MQLQYKTDMPDCKQYFLLFESTGWNEEYMLSKEELYSTLEKSYYNVSVYDEGKLIGFGRVISDGILTRHDLRNDYLSRISRKGNW